MFLLKISWNRNRNYLKPKPLFYFWRIGTGTDTDKFKRFQSLSRTHCICVRDSKYRQHSNMKVNKYGLGACKLRQKKIAGKIGFM